MTNDDFVIFIEKRMQRQHRSESCDRLCERESVAEEKSGVEHRTIESVQDRMQSVPCAIELDVKIVGSVNATLGIPG